MNSSRILGGILCVLCAFIALLHVYFGYVTGKRIIPPQGLAFALPVTVITLVALGLGFWLGWIMVTTRGPEPTPSKEAEEKSEESDG